MKSKTYTDSKMSSKAQVVIPANFRKKLGLKPGDTLRFSIAGDKLVAKKVDVNKLFDKYFGSMKGAWGNDPVKTIRDQRDQDWR